MTGPPGACDLSALSHLAPELAAAVVSVAGDIALVIDGDGVIRNVALASNPAQPAAGDWVGRKFVDTVTGETRQKIEQLLHEAATGGVSRRREVNHAFASGGDLPVAYSAVRLGAGGPLLAVGRDLRAVAAIQQRFVESQQEMERDYWKRRQAESRYRLLFQVATDAVLVVDGLSMQVVEANGAASKLFGADSLVGQAIASVIAAESRPAVEELLAAARTTGRPAEIRARTVRGLEAIDISAAPFRSDTSLLLLVRARAAAAAPDESSRRSAEFVEGSPDAVVITDAAGRIVAANRALVELFQADGPISGRSIGEWFDDGAAVKAMLELVRRNGIASCVVLRVRGSRGSEAAVEMSAALLDEGEQERIGLTLRRLRSGGSLGAGEVAHAIEALDAGERSLPELVQAAAHLAERRLIEAALARSPGAPAEAATLLRIDLDLLRERMAHHGLALDGVPGRRVLN